MSKLAVGVLAAFALAAGQSHAAPPAPGSTYVALGSSYAAGTSLPRPADDGLAGCGQGSDSYPRQVARALQLKLVDRSCGGAVTDHILKGGQLGLPAQLASVTGDTALVTITIGGNDVRFTADLGRYSCRNHAGDAPAGSAPAACGEAPADFQLDRAFAELEPKLRQLLAEIHARAPRARIVFVDYVTIVPPAGTCAALGLSADEAADMRGRATRLAALTAKVAAEARADLIQASSLTRGHDACSAAPWGWGYVSAAERARANAVPFHPRLEATTAVATAIVERLRQ